MVLFTTHAHTLSLVERALTSPQQQQSRVWRQRRDVSVALISCSFAFFSSNTQSTARARRDVAQPEAITKTRHTHTQRLAPSLACVCVRGTERCDQWGLCKEYAKVGEGAVAYGEERKCVAIYTHTYMYISMCVYMLHCVCLHSVQYYVLAMHIVCLHKHTHTYKSSCICMYVCLVFATVRHETRCWQPCACVWVKQFILNMHSHINMFMFACVCVH